jgi:hypothetical protein
LVFHFLGFLLDESVPSLGMLLVVGAGAKLRNNVILIVLVGNLLR